LRAVKQFHLVVGIAAIALYVVVAVYGAWLWRQASLTRWFWRLLRTAQAVVVLQVALGGILVATGSKPPGLHVLYGILPLLVSVIAESLRAASAQLVLDQRGLESAQAVRQLPDTEQREVVVAIIRREMAVMALAALVVVVLLARAAQTHG
jgi:heme A synthase